jgi:uroporphyrinogen decarboxylase
VLIMASTGKPLLDTVLGHVPERPPIWIMRQAGRYLPEYRQTRSKVNGFLELCYSPELAAEVTLQPLRRFDLDAAIIFSDILVIPDALGQGVRYVEGEGPVLDPVDEASLGLLKPRDVKSRLAPVLEAITRVRAALPVEKTLIGFCGSPWTVATYMIGGRGSPNQAAARLFALRQPAAFHALIDMLVEASIDHLAGQLRAGADVVQLFESWALNLDEVAFSQYVIEPNRRIVEGLRRQIPDAPVIGFPRGAAAMLGAYVEATGVNVVGLDFAIPPQFAAGLVPAKVGLQGNLDPLRLVAGGEQMRERAEAIIAACKGRSHIFNLGHGIVPETPIEHVAELVDIVKGRS